MNGVQQILWSRNLVKLVTSFTRKMNVLNYQYRIGNSFALQTDCIDDLGVHTDCKLHFHHHVNFPFFTRNAIIRTCSYTYIFHFYNSLLMLYFSLVISKLEYTSIAWNSVTINDSNKRKHTRKVCSPLP
jgi:hypothetical protein